MEVNSVFAQFYKNLDVTNTEDIFNKIKRITKKLNSEFYDTDSETDNCFIIGSFGRNTAINGVSDLDVIFKLPDDLYTQYNSHQNNGQSALLQRVKNAVLLTYPQTNIRGDQVVIVVQFLTFKIEICPAFLNSDGTFTYPDSKSGGSWKVTKPEQEIAETKEYNEISKGKLIELCRIVRAWKNKFGVQIGGLLIDTLCYNFLKKNEDFHEDGFDEFPSIIVKFFEYLLSFSNEQTYWLAIGSNQKVYKKSNFRRKASKSVTIAIEAKDNIDSHIAYKKYRRLFGRPFPYVETLLEKAETYSRTEQFIEDLYPVDIIYSVKIDAIVKQAGFRDTLLSVLNILRDTRKLSFFIKSCNVPEPYEVKWKVLNKGDIAKKRDMIRGQIMNDNGTQTRNESSTFNGPHYVECYVIKDNICVARDRIDVEINI